MSSAATILIVEDDRFNVRLLSEICRNAGYDVRVATDGLAAVGEIEQARPDLVLLDIMIPEIDGYGVLERIRANARTADLPVVMVTAVQDVEARNKAIDLGADDFISKPFKLFELQTRVRNALQLRQFRRKLRADLTPGITVDPRELEVDESGAVGAALDSLKVSGASASVITVDIGEVEGEAREAVIAVTRSGLPTGRSSLFSRRGRRLSAVVPKAVDEADSMMATLADRAQDAAGAHGAADVRIRWGVGHDLDSADAACDAAAAEAGPALL